MNDIFANDNSARNKTKTIFLLSIVAIILIAVFLIIAWVMTRDNTIQPIEAQGENERIQSPQKEIPYAHSEDSKPNPNVVSSTDNQLGLNLDSTLATTPPPSAGQAPQNQTPQIPGFKPVTQESNSQNLAQNQTPNFLPPPNVGDTPNYEDDPKYQENLKNLQAKNAQKNAQQVNTTQKVVTPPPPKELKPSDKDSKDSKKDSKATPPPASTKDSKTIQNRATDSKDTKDKAKPKVAEKKPESNTESKIEAKPASDKKDDKILQRPKEPVKKDNGAPAQKGHYIQVGSFPEENKVDTLFMQNIQKYGYRIQKFDNNGKPFVRYLVGPYKDQQEAKSKLNEIKTQLNGNAIYKEVK